MADGYPYTLTPEERTAMAADLERPAGQGTIAWQKRLRDQHARQAGGMTVGAGAIPENFSVEDYRRMVMAQMLQQQPVGGIGEIIQPTGQPVIGGM